MLIQFFSHFIFVVVTRERIVFKLVRTSDNKGLQ